MRPYEVAAFITMFTIFILFSTVFFVLEDSYSAYSDPHEEEEEEEEGHYWIGDYGYLFLDGHPVICSIEGWEMQTLYYRHNLPVLADGCTLETSK